MLCEDAFYIRPSGAVEPAPPYPERFLSTIGQQVTTLLETLRKQREGDPVKQAAAPRKVRTKRQGDLSLSEFAKQHGIGPRQIRKMLHGLGILQIEIEAYEREASPPLYLRKARLTNNAVEKGIGRRITPYAGRPFDVLTPKGQLWVSKRLDERHIEQRRIEANKISPRHVTRERVRGLIGEGRSQIEIVRLTGIPKQTVSRHFRALKAA